MRFSNRNLLTEDGREIPYMLSLMKGMYKMKFDLLRLLKA